MERDDKVVTIPEAPQSESDEELQYPNNSKLPKKVNNKPKEWPINRFEEQKYSLPQKEDDNPLDQ